MFAGIVAFLGVAGGLFLTNVEEAGEEILTEVLFCCSLSQSLGNITPYCRSHVWL